MTIKEIVDRLIENDGSHDEIDHEAEIERLSRRLLDKGWKSTGIEYSGNILPGEEKGHLFTKGFTKDSRVINLGTTSWHHVGYGCPKTEAPDWRHCPCQKRLHFEGVKNIHKSENGEPWFHETDEDALDKFAGLEANGKL